MNYLVFDTETISIDKPFCYNIGYIIADQNHTVMCKRDYVVEQIWHNQPLFSTAYYATKKPIYVTALRQRASTMEKWGYIMRQLDRDIKKYNVQCAFAYNSPFDDKVIDFNCDWFHCINPFDTVPILDIRGYAHAYICDNAYCQFCDTNSYYTESGNYSSTAESMYRYITQNTQFIEEHTALSDSEIEHAILIEALNRGATLGDTYPIKASIQRNIPRTLTVTDKATGTTTTFQYTKLYITKDKSKIVLN